MPSLVGDCGQVLRALGWAVTRILKVFPVGERGNVSTLGEFSPDINIEVQETVSVSEARFRNNHSQCCLL